jgi:hypothetical protein
MRFPDYPSDTTHDWELIASISEEFQTQTVILDNKIFLKYQSLRYLHNRRHNRLDKNARRRLRAKIKKLKNSRSKISKACDQYLAKRVKSVYNYQ